MKCPKCQFENPDQAKFCMGCGQPMELHCPACGTTNPAFGRFCMDCGQDLTASSAKPAPPVELSFEEKLENIQRYLPGGLTEKILAQRGKIEGERKQVTVMFCDTEGFSTLSEKLGPEKVYSIIDVVFEMLIHKVNEFGGTVNKMTGDGVMALFGAPIALEDAPQRAIRSALAIQRDIARFSDRQKAETGAPLRMRIGIHTGPVVVGTLGNDLRVEFTAVGDTVNLASRMEGLAEPGTVYVTDETFKLTEGLFRFEALGERLVKGKEAPVKAYRVIAPSTRRTRVDVSAERGLTPFLGRERELELLIDGLDRAKSGRGQAFSIMGEAGVGKSRLLYEFRKVIANQDVFFQEGRCLSYSTNVAYHPVIDLLKATFDIRDADNDDRISEKVKTGLKGIGADEASTLPFILEMLSVKDSGIDALNLSPEARKDKTLEALKKFMLKASEVRPLVMAVEDLHWVDKSSEETFKDWMDAISGVQILLIFTYRPEFVHTWGRKSYHNQVTLNCLSNRETMAMAAYILGTEVMGEDLEELILNKTEGIPFFVEEFMKSLKDLGMIEWRDSGYYLAKDIQEVEIPSTIQEVIMARVDALPEGAKSVLQTGSAIGREFSCELIKRVTGIPTPEMTPHLSVLRDSELLYERGIFPQATYVFRHSLTQEVAYDSLLQKKKQEIHERIGQAIEELYNDNLYDYYELLSEHFIKGENFERGAEYCRLAGRKAEKASSLYEAIPYGHKRIACLEKQPQVEDVQRKIVDARTILGLYYGQMNHHIEAKEAIEPIVDLALELGYEKRVSQIYSIMGAYSLMVEEDFPKAFKYLEDALRIAEELNDPLSLAMANYTLGAGLLWTCKFERGIYHIKKVLEINVAANVLWGIATMRCIIALSYIYSGRIDLGYQASEEALRTAETSGDIQSKAYAYTFHGGSCYCMGFLDEAVKHLVQGIDLSETINEIASSMQGRLWLADTYFDLGEYKRFRDCLEKAISQLQEKKSFTSWLNLAKISLVRAKVINNDRDINLIEIFKLHEKNRYENLNGWISRYIGEILLNVDEKHLSEAEDWIKKAIEADKRNGMMFLLGKDYVLYAELFKRKGDALKVKENLNQAIDLFKECGSDGWVEKTEKELKALSKKK